MGYIASLYQAVRTVKICSGISCSVGMNVLVSYQWTGDMSRRGTNVGNYVIKAGHVDPATSQNHDNVSDCTVCSPYSVLM